MPQLNKLEEKWMGALGWGTAGCNTAELILLRFEMYLAKFIICPLSEHKETPVHEHFYILELQVPFLCCEHNVIECL
jgi:hypothetical protein